MENTQNSQNNKMNKNQKMARWAIDNGYTHIAAVVKQVFNTCYYNVQSAEEVLLTGKWPKCYSNGAHPVGTIDSAINWDKTVTREQARRSA